MKIILRIVIVVVVYLIGRFIYDSIKQSIQMKKQGGVAKKYAGLIQLLLSSQYAEIIQKTNTYVNIYDNDLGCPKSYQLMQSWGKLMVRIEYKKSSAFGNMTIERYFPENMDQLEMFKELLKAETEEMGKRIGGEL